MFRIAAQSERPGKSSVERARVRTRSHTVKPALSFLLLWCFLCSPLLVRVKLELGGLVKGPESKPIRLCCQRCHSAREALVRLSEMGASSDISTEQRVELCNAVLDTVRLIAATEFANSGVPDEAKNEALKRFSSDTAENTVTIPDKTKEP